MKRFDETNIDWLVIQKQLLAWGELFRASKKTQASPFVQLLRRVHQFIAGHKQ